MTEEFLGILGIILAIGNHLCLECGLHKIQKTKCSSSAVFWKLRREGVEVGALLSGSLQIMSGRTIPGK